MTRKLKIYIDTSVLGGFFDKEDPKRIRIAETFLKLAKREKFDVYLSRLTIEEISKAPTDIRDNLKNIITGIDVKVLEETEECIELSQMYVDEGVIPKRFRDDARHIAIATFYNLDFLISWNYRHMVNIRVKKLVSSVNLKMGFNPIEIISPEEVVGYEEVGI